MTSDRAAAVFLVTDHASLIADNMRPAGVEPATFGPGVQYGFGKPPDEIETNLEPKTTLRLYYAHEFDKKFGDTKVVARSLPDSASNSEGTLRLSLPDAD